MKYVKIENGIIVAISEQKIAGWIETSKDVSIGMQYDGTNFFFSAPTLEDGKKSVELLLKKLSDSSTNKLSLKYDFYNKFGTIEQLKREVFLWDADNTALTPTIDRVANVNGRTRYREIDKIKAMQLFTNKMGDVQLATSKAKERATTDADIQAILGVLMDFASCQNATDSKTCFIGKADANIEILKAI